MSAPMNYVLIDFENVQPKDLELLKNGSFKVKVFVGPNQHKIPIALATAMQSLGDNAEYILLERAGKNALDFCIAYYLGALSSADPKSYFHILSKDSGFDPLLEHLNGKKIRAGSYSCVADIPLFKADVPVAFDERVKTMVTRLVRMKAAKPKSLKTLISTMNAHFKKQLSEEQITELFSELCKRGIVKVQGQSVSYSLPEES